MHPSTTRRKAVLASGVSCPGTKPDSPISAVLNAFSFAYSAPRGTAEKYTGRRAMYQTAKNTAEGCKRVESSKEWMEEPKELGIANA